MDNFRVIATKRRFGKTANGERFQHSEGYVVYNSIQAADDAEDAIRIAKTYYISGKFDNIRAEAV